MKRILLIATGGTIASTEDGNGLSPALTGEELAQSVPEISGLCELDVVQPMNIDSTNMRPSDWMRIRDVIVEGYADHDGFVILHGTDTMSYTAAALSYLIQDSPKPIVLTGSQKPMGNPFTDAKLNLYQSLLYALDEHSHDVSIVFGGVAIAGTRARKQRTMSFNAFISVNYPPIAYIRNDRIVRNGLHGTHQGENPVRFYDSIDPRVFVLKLTPGVNPGILDAQSLHLFHQLAGQVKLPLCRGVCAALGVGGSVNADIIQQSLVCTHKNAPLFVFDSMIRFSAAIYKRVQQGSADRSAVKQQKHRQPVVSG